MKLFNPMELFPRRIRKIFPPEEVTHHSPQEIDPREVGLEREDIESIWREVVRYYQTGLHPALSICIRRQGKIILQRSIGHARGNAPDAPLDSRLVGATPDTPFNIFSASKCVTAMLVHLLVEREQVGLDQAVADYIPEFARHGKGAITVRHLLCHRAGIPIPPKQAMDVGILGDWERVLETCYNLRPQYPPGEVLAYHPITTGFVMAEIISRVTGKDIQTFLRDEIGKPLGFTNLTYGARPEVLPHVAQDAITGPRVRFPISNWLEKGLGASASEVINIAKDERFLSGVVPSGNIIGSADEIGRFFEMLLRGGTLDGVTIFQPKTLETARVSHSKGEIDRIIKLPINYGLGFMLGGSLISIYGTPSPMAFGHVGFSNVMAWADPERDISVAFLNSGKPVFTPEFLLWLHVPHMIAKRIPRDHTAIRH